MRTLEKKEINATREDKLLQEFRSAAFGDFCRSIAYTSVDDVSSEAKQVWYEALQESNGKWTLMHNEALLDPADKDATDFTIVSSVVADTNITFFDAVQAMAEFESMSEYDGLIPETDNGEEKYGDTYFRPFAVREAIAFDARTHMPAQTHKGRIATSGEFTMKMRNDVQAAWQAKSRVFRMPQFDISRRLGLVNDGTSAEDLKRYLRTKERLPQYISAFEDFLKAYKESAENNFLRGMERREVSAKHDELEECIDKFPENSYPAREDLRMIAANLYLYYTIQQLQARYQDARNNGNNASEFIEETAMSDLKTLGSYYKDRARSALPSATKLTRLIMDDNFAIEGTPPSDIMENFIALKQWQENMEKGVIMPDAKLPDILPISSYIPMDVSPSVVKANIDNTRLAEQIVAVAQHSNHFLEAYNQWRASDCKDERLWNRMADEDTGLHNKLEEAIQAMPYNDILDKDQLTLSCCNMWIAAELWRLKALHGEDNDEVRNRIGLVIGYHEVCLKNTKDMRQTRDFRKDFPNQAIATISEDGNKIPDTIKLDYKEWHEALSEFAMAYRQGGLEAAANATRTREPSPTMK